MSPAKTEIVSLSVKRNKDSMVQTLSRFLYLGMSDTTVLPEGL
jgi:hypothetical protein